MVDEFAWEIAVHLHFEKDKYLRLKFHRLNIFTARFTTQNRVMNVPSSIVHFHLQARTEFI